MTIVVTIAVVVVIEMAEMDARTIAAVLAVAVAEAIVVGHWRSCVIQEVMDRYTRGGRVAWEGRYRVLVLILMLMFNFLSLCGDWWCWWREGCIVADFVTAVTRFSLQFHHFSSVRFRWFPSLGCNTLFLLLVLLIGIDFCIVVVLLLFGSIFLFTLS